ncbi:phage tail protein [Paenibacillus glycanilyticus]|uniref:phage tail spike protein n=1 Tax=Paenibacillus glycanilyticus TaxID=126569 RepID=UPI0020424532|nr:phage tail spike protein [Paenibacillus glycanilyticus]MCM3628809.1 phage tail protein [Paenibacillus glycanilyticus]
MDNYIVIYDKLETDFSHYGLATITVTLDPGPRIYERMNAEFTCEFTVPYMEPGAKYLIEENIVKVEKQLFIIRTAEDVRDAKGQLYKSVFAEHISTELLTEYVPLLRYTSATGAAIVGGLLTGTRFEGNATAITTLHDFTVERNMVSWGINHFLELTNGEMKRDNFNITFKPQIGNDNGVRISYRKNLQSIKRTKESRGIITRLFVYGKDDLALPNPIDSPNINLYPRPKNGSVTFDDVEDLETLQTKGEDYLATVDTPLLSYEADVIELKYAEGWDESEGFELGDTVHIDDEDLDIVVTARIVEYERYPFDPSKSRVTLANFLPSLSDTVTKLQESSNIIDRVTTGGGKLNSSWIEGKINTLKNQLIASGSYATSDVLDNQGFLLENTDENSPDYGALYLGPGIFAIASEKINGDWNWQTFGTGKGFTASLVRTGILEASLIRINSSTSFDPGYDPSTKETPEGAQGKADAAQVNAKSYADNLKTETDADIADINDTLDGLGDIVDGTFADGIIEQAEASSIAKYLNTLSTEKADLDSRYTNLNANSLLTGTPKTNLTSAKTATDTSYSNLISAINSAIADGKTTPTEKSDVDTKFADYKSKIATLSTRFTEAINAIATTSANNAGQAAKDASVLKGTKYNSVYMDANGFHIDNATGEVVRMGQFANGQYGVITYHTDGSTTALTPAGLIRKTATGEMPYSYLTAAGSGITGTSGSYFNTATDNDGSSIADVTISLPTDFKGKDFKVFLALKLDSFYTQELKQNPSAGLRVANQAPAVTYLEVTNKNTMNGTFTVKGYGSLYRWNVIYTVSGSTVVPQYGLPTRYDYALEFTWIAIA